MKVDRTGVEFGLLMTDLATCGSRSRSVVCGSSGVPGRANSSPCPLFLLLQKEPSLCSLTFWKSPEETRAERDLWEGLFVVFFFYFPVVSSFQNSSSHEATLGRALSFLRNGHKQSPESLPSPGPLLSIHPFWCLRGAFWRPWASLRSVLALCGSVGLSLRGSSPLADCSCH